MSKTVYIADYCAAVKKLYVWVGEQYDIVRGSAPAENDSYTHGKIIGGMYAHTTIRQEMRTLFAGLINFDE